MRRSALPCETPCHPCHSQTHIHSSSWCVCLAQRCRTHMCIASPLCEHPHPPTELVWRAGVFWQSFCQMRVMSCSGQLDSSLARCGDWQKGVQIWESWVGMVAHIGEMKGSSCLYGGTSWGWCWEMGSGPVLMGVAPFLHPASFTMGQGACSQSPPSLYPLPNKEEDQHPSAGCCFIQGHLSPSLQPVGGMGYRVLNPWATPAFLRHHLPPLH